MHYYKDPTNRLHVLNDHAFVHLLPDGCIEITEDEARAIQHPVPTHADIILALTSTLEAMYDREAQSRRYDNRFTCALRAGYPGPFQAEGLAFASWMDACNAKAYAIMADCLDGKRGEPSEEELLREMPTMEW